MRIAIGSDHGGFYLKQELVLWLRELGYEVNDYGTTDTASVDYPDYAIKVANSVAQDDCDKGILVCGTGIGMAITANKVKGIRASSITNIYSARMFREHNDGNLLCLGARVLGLGLAQDIVKTFLTTEFAGGRHDRRVNKINSLDEQ